MMIDALATFFGFSFLAVIGFGLSIILGRMGEILLEDDTPCSRVIILSCGIVWGIVGYVSLVIKVTVHLLGGTS